MNKFMELAINEVKKGIRNKGGGPFDSVKYGRVYGITLYIEEEGDTE